MSGCTAGKDGNLLAAVDIGFYDIVDSVGPISGPGSASNPGSSSSHPPLTVHPFFTGGTPPAIVVAGSHHSGCTSYP
jgi:hypothetical protein